MSFFKLLSVAALLARASAVVPTRVAAALPSGCDIPPSYTVTSFYWHNSTHNLNCIEYQDYSDYYTDGCLDDKGQWCDPDDDGCSNCDIPYCNDNVPPQPLGYGPPDVVKFSYSEGTYCESSNSAGSQSWDIGNGIVLCGGSRGFMQFFGDSNPDNSTARVSVSPPPTTCANGSIIYPYYDAKFDIVCAHDTGNNATCRATQTTIEVPFSSSHLEEKRPT